MRALRVAVLVTCAGVLSCAAEFTPRSVLNDLRVLALVASPLEVGASEDVTLSAVTVPPPAAFIRQERWTFCPFSVGATAGYACAVPECEVELPPLPDGSVTARPGELARQCLARLAGQASLPAGTPSQLPDQVQTIFRYVVTASDGQSREAVQRLTLYPAGPPPDRNVPPVITAVEIGGRRVANGDLAPALAPARPLEVHVTLDPASAQAYVDAAGLTLRESLVVSFYTTAGRFDYDRASGPDASVTLQYEQIDAVTTEAEVWAVARDLRGGETVAGPFRVPIRH